MKNIKIIYYKGIVDYVNDRIKQIRTTLNISQRDFAKRIYISQTLLGNIELGNRNVNDRTIQLISTAFNVNKNWLLTGEGEIFTIPAADMKLSNLIDNFNQLEDTLKDFLIEQSKSLLKMQKEKKS